MKKLLTFIMACVISLGVTAQISKEAFEKWHQNKYSMFIHFGLYSELGGVWEGSPVTRGPSTWALPEKAPPLCSLSLHKSGCGSRT